MHTGGRQWSRRLQWAQTAPLAAFRAEPDGISLPIPVGSLASKQTIKPMAEPSRDVTNKQTLAAITALAAAIAGEQNCLG